MDLVNLKIKRELNRNIGTVVIEIENEEERYKIKTAIQIAAECRNKEMYFKHDKSKDCNDEILKKCSNCVRSN